MKIKYLCFVLLLTWVAGACSKDDDNDGFRDDGRFSKRKVSRIYVSEGEEKGFNLIFEYNGRGEIARITESWVDKDSTVYEFTFTDDAVCMTKVYNYPGRRGSSFTMIRPLNEQLYVARCTTGVHSYDAEGHLLTTGRDTLKWEAGNLVEGNEKSDIEYLEYKYTDVENKSNIDFSMAMFYHYYRPDWYDDYLDALGYYGKTNRNLLASTRYCTYTYKYDKKGYVIAFTEKPTSKNIDFNEPTTYKVEYYD